MADPVLAGDLHAGWRRPAGHPEGGQEADDAGEPLPEQVEHRAQLLLDGQVAVDRGDRRAERERIEVGLDRGGDEAVLVLEGPEHGALGESPVESDGSFYLHVPSDQPLRFELLDKSGATVAAQKSWMWVRRGEQRICVGCHAGPERAPDNAVPKVLESNTKPVIISGGRP